jgi:hypothetical protein
VDRPPSPQVERTTLDSLKPSSPKGAQRSPGAGGTLISPTCATPSEDPAGASSALEPIESPRAPPPSPRSHGLGVVGGSQHGEGSSTPQPEEVPRQHSWVAESLWDNPDFIQAGFHVGRFITAAVDTEAGRENIKALYSSLKTTLDQIDVSARQLVLLHPLDGDLTLSLHMHW